MTIACAELYDKSNFKYRVGSIVSGVIFWYAFVGDTAASRIQYHNNVDDCSPNDTIYTIYYTYTYYYEYNGSESVEKVTRPRGIRLYMCTVQTPVYMYNVSLYNIM